MRLYSKNNQDDVFDRFEIDLKLPIIKKLKQDSEWSPESGFDVMFNTQLLYRKDHSFTYFELTLLGFGISITKQLGY